MGMCINFWENTQRMCAKVVLTATVQWKLGKLIKVKAT